MRDALHDPSPAHAEQWVGWCCSYCGAPLVPRGSGLFCRAEQRWFATREGVHLLLPEERRRAIRAFREIRARVRREPARRPRDVCETEDHWREVLALAEATLGSGSWDVLEAGRGRGDHARRLLGSGHRVASVDSGLEPDEGVVTVRSSVEPLLPRAEAELDALPLEPGRFDLVLASGSLHYGPSLARTLVELRRVTRRRGALIAFDSPVFRKRADGERQIVRAMREERALLGMAVPREARPGYLVREELPEQFRDAGWSLQMLGWPRPMRELFEDGLRRLRCDRRAGRHPMLFATRDG
jgi:SAM-dependent methyltransferase